MHSANKVPQAEILQTISIAGEEVSTLPGELVERIHQRLDISELQAGLFFRGCFAIPVRLADNRQWHVPLIITKAL